MSRDSDHELPAAELQGMARLLGLEGRPFNSDECGDGQGSASLPCPASLRDRFEILELIDRGGMGSVYRARRRSDGLFFAVKVLAEGVSSDPLFRERLARESDALTRLSHPNIVSIIEFIDEPDGCSLVMELISGEPLRTVMDREQVPPLRAIEIIQQIGSALAFAHQTGVVHRDVKPNNVLLDSRGKVRVVDFGIAKLISHSASSYTLTATGATLGTPIYVAPELCQGEDGADHRADIYSLGVLFYELLTGKLPLGRFRAPSEEMPGVPHALDRIVLKALDNYPQDRWQTVTRMLHELKKAADSSTEKPRKRPCWIVSTVAMATVAVLAAAFWNGSPATTDSSVGSGGSTAARTVPFVNSLEMQFVPVAGTSVLFSIWETRVSDFRTFVEATDYDASSGFYSYDLDHERNQKVLTGGDWSTPGFAQSGAHPVVGISWFDAVAFCEWLTKLERGLDRISERQRYRLPENDEWTAAADLKGRFPWGNDATPPSGAGNFAGQELAVSMPALGRNPDYHDGHTATAPAGSFPANKFGIFDLAGNVWEWTGNALDDRGEITFRGGSWTNGSLGVYQSGLSHRWQPGLRVNDIGFRVVLIPGG